MRQVNQTVRTDARAKGSRAATVDSPNTAKEAATNGTGAATTSEEQMAIEIERVELCNQVLAVPNAWHSELQDVSPEQCGFGFILPQARSPEIP